MNVILPQTSTTQIGMAGGTAKKTYPVLYLLHGCSDDHTIWERRTSIERYVAGMDLAVVMPNVHRSYYTDMYSGGNYWTFISEELPGIVKQFFPISDKREDTFVAGLSMGGYGSLKLAFNHPERYAAAASLSAVTDPCTFWDSSIAQRGDEMSRIFGTHEMVKNSMNDLFHMSAEVSKSNSEKPMIFQCCGTEDFLYEDNLRFQAHMENLDFEFHYQEAPGMHEWGFWDRHIQDILKWLPLKK
jgi:S-formylglutathione hydrolase FrmB